MVEFEAGFCISSNTAATASKKFGRDKSAVIVRHAIPCGLPQRLKQGQAADN